MAAAFRASRYRLQADQRRRLAEELPLHQLIAPFVFSDTIGPAEIETIAQALARAGDRLRRRGRRTGRVGHLTPVPAGMASIDDLVEERSIVVCCGSGGVGKTTVSAAFALEGARRGRKACVVTIDPGPPAGRCPRSERPDQTRPSGSRGPGRGSSGP
jgi:Mrp family chromosome partitioning ATPase